MDFKFEWVDLVLVSPAIVLFLASIIPLTIKVLNGNREQNTFATVVYGLIGIVAASGLVIANQNAYKVAFGGALIFDGISTWSSLIVLFITALTLLFSRENYSTNTRQFSEYVFLVLNAAIGMLTVVWSHDLIVTFVGIELMSLSLYMLIALSSEFKLSKEAAFKYFVLGSFASAIFLYGIAFIYGTAGTTELNKISELATDLATTNRLFLFGMALVILGICFKVSIFPFHNWLPDVYQGSPTPVTAFMATGVKAVTFGLFLRVIVTNTFLSERSEMFFDALQWLAVFTILVGNIGAVMQNNFKRMLAYSSVAHSGYAMIGLLAAGIGGNAMLGASGVLYYMFAYAIMTIGSFGVVSLLEKNEDSIVLIDDLKGLSRRNPWVAICITIFMLSLAGLPPTIGFFGKFFIFSAAVKQGLFWMAVWGVIGSVISVYYYLRPVVVMYMSDEQTDVHAEPGRQLTQFAVSLSAILILVIGFTADPFYRMVWQAVSKLFPS